MNEHTSRDTDVESPGPMTGLSEADLHAQDAAAERDDHDEKPQFNPLEKVAEIAAQCCIDLDSNLKSANEEYMAGKIPRGAFEYVLMRHTALHMALQLAGYTETHPIFGCPMKPN